MQTTSLLSRASTMQRSTMRQQLHGGQPTRQLLCRTEWLQMLRCRVAAASSVVRRAAAAATSSSDETVHPPADAPVPATRVRRSRRSKTGSGRVSERLNGAEEAPVVPKQHHRASVVDSNQGADQTADAQFHITENMSASNNSKSPAVPGSAAAALKQRRVAAAAAKQQQQEQADTVSSHSSDRHLSKPQKPAAHKTLPRTAQHKPVRQQSRQLQGLQDSQLKPALQELLQQMQEAHQAADPLQQLYQQPRKIDYQLSPLQQTRQQRSAVVQLTQLIQGVGHPRQLVHILVAGAGSLNAVHVTAAAEALLRFVREMQQLRGDEKDIGIYKTKVKVAFKQLCKLLTGQLLDLDSRAVISLLHCFSKMGAIDQHFQPQQLWGDLLHISTSMMADFNPQQLAMLVYAVAQADPWAEAKPSRRWWMLYFESSRHSMSDFAPQGFANMVWAMGKLQRRPGAEWANALYTATEPQLGMFTPQGLANLGSGLGHMNGLGLSSLPRPGQQWMKAYLEAAEQQLEGFSSQGLANLLWTLARLGYCPPKDSIKVLIPASLNQLQRGSAQDLSLIVYSFAVLQVKLPDTWWNRYWAVSVDKMEQAGSQALANTFYALGKQKRVPPHFWLASFLPAMQAALPQCSAQAAANVLWAAGHLRLAQLPGSWIDSLLERVYQQLQECKALELSIIVSALKRLHYKPSQKWLEGFYAASQQKLAAFTAPQLAAALEALSALSPSSTPPAAWSAAVLAQVSARLPTLRAPELTAVIWGLSELKIMPSKDLMSRFMAASAENLHLMDGPMLSRTLRTLVRLGQKPNANWLFLLAEESYYHLSKLQSRQLADLVWGFGQLRYSPGSSWLARVAEAAQHELSGFSAADIVRFVQGLAGVRYKPSVGWLGAVGCRVQQMLGEMTAQELLQCVAALERLGMGPGAVLMQQLSAGGLGTTTAAQALAEAAASKSAGVPATAPVATAAAPSHSSSQGMHGLPAAESAGEVGGAQRQLKRLELPQRPGHAVVPAAESDNALQKPQALAGVNGNGHQGVQDLKAVGGSKEEGDPPAASAAPSSPHELQQLVQQGKPQDGRQAQDEVPDLLLPRPQRPRRPTSPLESPFAASR